MIAFRILPILLLGACLGAQSASAGDYPVFAEPSGFSILDPQDPPPPGGPFSYTASAPVTNWNIAIWHIPVAKMSSFVSIRQGGYVHTSSTSPESSFRADGDDRGYSSYELSQDGTYLPCEFNGQPRESDFLISPNGNNIKPPAVSGYLVPINKWSLTAMTRLVAHATVGLRFRDTPTIKGCSVTQGAPLISVVLNNLTAHQTLFYKVSLALACGSNVPPERNNWCRRMNAHPTISYYFKKNPFGVDDQLPLLGQPWLANDETRTFNLDLLPRLLELIAQAPPAMDHDPSHWTLGGYYNGQHIWGDLIMHSSWRDFSLTISAEGSPP